MGRLWRGEVVGMARQQGASNSPPPKPQASPRVAKAMRSVLDTCFKAVGGHWVGSSVVHLGDHNVPNSFGACLHVKRAHCHDLLLIYPRSLPSAVFLDKYSQVSSLIPYSPEYASPPPHPSGSQVSRILSPIVATVEAVPRLVREHPTLIDYIKLEFGSVANCQLTILTDFFRHGFDGSGADNFMDAGSCIDGRLTSAWEWCSKLDRKSYAPIFKLAGSESERGTVMAPIFKFLC